MKILCLGNELIERDSFAKKIGEELRNEGYNIIEIKDIFQLIQELNNQDEIIILDVVEKIKEVCFLKPSDLKHSKIISAHDFDAGFVLSLLDLEKIKILGIPLKGNLETIKKQVGTKLINI